MITLTNILLKGIVLLGVGYAIWWIAGPQALATAMLTVILVCVLLA